MTNFRGLREKLELFLRKYKFHILIPLNLLLPIVVIHHSMMYKYHYITEQPGMFFWVSIASILNLYLCALLGEEINREGFRALIWAAFFNYAAFFVLAIWHYATINSNRRISERESLEKMRKLLRVN